MDALFATMRKLHSRGPRARGLVVDADGAMLGPDCVLVRRTADGYRAVSNEMLTCMQGIAFGKDGHQPRLPFVLGRIADALETGDVVRAQLLGLSLAIGELDDDQLRQLRVAAMIMKADYNQDEPRDDRGRWTSGGGSAEQAPLPDPDVTPQQGRILPAAFPSPERAENAEDAAYQGYYHDDLVQQLAKITRKAGGKAVTSVPLVSVDGAICIADMIAQPKGWPPFVIEVKTGLNPSFTPAQADVYGLLSLGGHVLSPKAEIAQFGLAPGVPLPPLRLLLVYTLGPGSLMTYEWYPPLPEVGPPTLKTTVSEVFARSLDRIYGGADAR